MLLNVGCLPPTGQNGMRDSQTPLKPALHLGYVLVVEHDSVLHSYLPTPPRQCTCLLAQVHLVERIPFFDALYFVTTTLTTVGYGDIVAISPLGKAAVLAMILVGVVLIPVQTSQLYSQLTARRLTLGVETFTPLHGSAFDAQLG